MNRRNRLNGSPLTEEDLRLEQALRQAANTPMPPQQFGYRWHPSPLAQPVSALLPDAHGNPFLHIIGGMTLIEEVAARMMPAPAENENEFQRAARAKLAVEDAIAILAITRPQPKPAEQPPADPPPASGLVLPEDSGPNPPAPETVA